ncbi:MAG: hypothetical protein IKQ15_01110 [Kiritimatiellae bacterium]|nr:hypothetical protein [Kiritimatiellia bacterium]
MKSKIFNWIVVGIGFLLLFMGFSIASQQKEWEEQIKGTKGKCALYSGLGGAAVGGGVGACIGGVGVVACGTGVGIPAGVVCLGLAALLGVGSASAGYVLGKPTTSIVHSDPAFSTWIWLSLILLGLFFIGFGGWRLLAERYSARNNDFQIEKP